MRTWVPATDMRLHYDLAPGQVYDCHIEADDTITSLAYESSMSVEFSARIVVGESENGGHFVRAVVSDVTAGDGMPGLPERSRRWIDPAQAREIDGAELRFFLRDDGTVLGLVGGPENLVTPNAHRVLVAVTEALRASFLTLPPTRPNDGAKRRTWTTDAADPDTKWAVEVTGMFRDERSGQTVARVRSRRETRPKDHASLISMRAERDVATALFSADGYPVRLDRTRETRLEIMSRRLEVHAQWTRSPGLERTTDR